MSSQQTASQHGSNSRTGHLLHEVGQAVSHPVQTHPISTSLLVFGAGLGLGALIGTMIAEASTSRPTRFSQAEAVGRSILDSFSAALPDSLAKHLHM